MMINSRFLALAAAWILTLSIGFLVGRGTSASDPGGASRPNGPKGEGGSRLTDGGSGSSARPGKREEARSERQPGGPGPGRGISGEAALNALHANLRIGDSTERTRRLLDLLDSLAPEDFESFTEAFRKDDLAGIRTSEYELILSAWVKADPLATVDYLTANDPSGSARRTALEAWAALDPRAAFEWVQGKKDSGSQNDWYVGAISGIASNDPTEALALLQTLPVGRTRSAAMESVLPYVLQNGFGYATDWVDGIGDEKLQSETARHLADNLTRMDPEGAGQWVSNMQNVGARRDSSEEVSDQWARTDLESARRWVESLPADTITEGAEGVVRHMARQDPERAVDWINSLGIAPGENPDFDGARRIMLSELVTDYPELALENVSSLTREHERNYSSLLSRWARRDAAAARAWVEYNANVLPERIVRNFTRERK